MEKQYIDDTFLARWVAGELSPEELETFKKSDDYPYFKRINDGAQTLRAPSFDEQSSLAKFKQEKQFNSNNQRVVKLIPNWVYTTAAAVIIGLGLFFYMQNDEQFNTSFGEQLAITLPDNSKVQLNSNSSIDFNKKEWNTNRELHLEGEAFFDVEKGATFKVISDEGVVQVLGTEFNIISRDGFFEVLCHEGQVRVSNLASKELAVLNPGKAFRVINTTTEEWSFQEKKPTWVSGESSFKDAPLSYVMKALVNQYDVKFSQSNVNVNKRFTGSFTHNNLEIALETVFKPLGVSYSMSQNNTITLKEKN